MFVIFRQQVDQVLDKKAPFEEKIDFCGGCGDGGDGGGRGLHQITPSPFPKSFSPSPRALLSPVKKKIN